MRLGDYLRHQYGPLLSTYCNSVYDFIGQRRLNQSWVAPEARNSEKAQKEDQSAAVSVLGRVVIGKIVVGRCRPSEFISETRDSGGREYILYVGRIYVLILVSPARFRIIPIPLTSRALHARRPRP